MSEVKCILDKKHFYELPFIYHIPLTIKIKRPSPKQRADYLKAGRAAIYEEHLKVGLRLPVPKKVWDIFKHMGLGLAQVSPNSMRNIIMFCLACHQANTYPYPELFQR